MILEIDIILGVNKNFLRFLKNKFDYSGNKNHEEIRPRFNLC